MEGVLCPVPFTDAERERVSAQLKIFCRSAFETDLSLVPGTSEQPHVSVLRLTWVEIACKYNELVSSVLLEMQILFTTPIV